MKSQVNPKVGIKIYEDKVPIKPEVIGACELLGLDPFYVACEGRLIVIVDKNDSQQLLKKMRNNIYGQDSQIIGEVTDEYKGVYLQTSIGGTRIINMLSGEQLPRIC